MNTSEKYACKPSGMNTYKIIGLKVSWNEHLQKKVRGVGVLFAFFAGKTFSHRLHGARIGASPKSGGGAGLKIAARRRCGPVSGRGRGC
jgi:hypothetical protein